MSPSRNFLVGFVWPFRARCLSRQRTLSIWQFICQQGIVSLILDNLLFSKQNAITRQNKCELPCVSGGARFSRTVNISRAFLSFGCVYCPFAAAPRKDDSGALISLTLLGSAAGTAR